MKKLRRIISVLMVLVLLVSMSPEIVCEAAEGAWELVMNPKTPLDEVYFYCEGDENDNGGYFYGYIDGKAAVMDENYQLVQKTEFDMFNSKKTVMVKGIPAFSMSKEVDGQRLYGIMSEKGETIVEPQYSDLLLGTNAIKIAKKNDDKYLYGLLDYDCNEILPCKYSQVYVSGEKDGKMLFMVQKEDNLYSAIFDNKTIWTENQIGKAYYSFSEYEGKECIFRKFYPEDEEGNRKDEDKVVSYISYEGVVLKEMSYADWVNNNDDEEDDEIAIERYKAACGEWLNNKSEENKQHVIDFFESKEIELTNVEYTTSFCKGWDKNDKIVNYYFVTITAEYPKSQEYKNNEYDTNELIYVFIYDDKGVCITSGRSFIKVKIDGAHYMSLYNSKEMYVLTDQGEVQYFNKYIGKVEELFKVDESVLTYMNDSREDDMEMHKLYYNNGNIIDCIQGKKSKLFVSGNKQLYTYDYKWNDYYFIQGENSEIDVCFLDSETGKELIAYGQIDITIGKLKSSVKKRTVSGALWINDNNGKKLWFIKAGKSYSFIYDELEIDEIDYISDITDNERWAFVKLNTNEENKYFCFDLKNGKFSELIVKSGNLQYIDKILDTENNLYLYNEDGKILSVDKMTFVVSTIPPYEGLGKEIQISDTETKEETIESLVWINNQLYIGYMEEHGICNSEGNSRTYLYGIKDLLGEIKLGGFENVEIIICGDYIIIDSKIYASKIYDSTFKLLTDKGIYKKVFEGKEDGLAWVYSYDESSDMKVVLYNQNTGEKIYESAKEEPSYDNKKIDKYCKLEVYDKDTYEKRVLLINSENDEMVYQGKAFVHEDKKNQKVVVFEKKNSSKPIETPTIAPTVNPTEIPENTVAPTVSPTKKPVTGQIIPSYQYPPTITFTPEPTVTIAPTVSPSDTPVVTFEPTVNPTEIPENTVAPTVKPENTLVPTVTPGIAPDTDNNNTSSTNKINKGTKVTDKKTKAIYKVESTGSKKTVEYVDNTKKNVTSVSVPDTVKLHGKSYKVTSIGKNAFKDNKKLKKVKIGKNVKTIGKQAFAGCKKLTDITIGKNVTKIEANAFSKCSNLKIITIPENVKKIEKEAFYKCGKLQYFLFKTNKLTPKSVGKNAFGGGYGSPRVKTDKSVWEKYAKIFTSSGMSQDALFIIDPVKLVI